MVTPRQAYQHIRSRRRDRRRLTLTFGDANALVPSGIENEPWWLDRADFTADWGAETSAVFVWDTDAWTLYSGDLPPTAAGTGVLSQGGYVKAFDWINGDTA